MFTGKIKFNYLVIQVVLNTVIKGQKRVDLFEDRSRELSLDNNYMTINSFSRCRSYINDHQYVMYWFSLIGSHFYIGELNTP